MHILRLHCPDRPGIVATVATALSDSDCNIEESAQFHDPFSNYFFMRVVVSPVADGGMERFRKSFTAIATRFEMGWSLTPLAQPVKTLILVSKEDHCLNDLLYRWRTRQLNIDITAIASNHETCAGLAGERGLPYHHLPIEGGTKLRQEAALKDLIERTGSELIVLARYMQVLSDEFCAAHPGRIINIHHSFLPAFKGAKPYTQAFERGVKIIGATAHFATPDLDEGPIIEQETVRITHAHTPEKMAQTGKDTESRVLARAIGLYTERRIFLHGRRTVIL
jgi:formyltetrahydrofolate deformylase